MRKIKKHINYYLILCFVLAVGVIFFLQIDSGSNLKVSFLFTITLFYVLWGIFHHLSKHNLSLKIVIEYILIGAFGLTIALFFIKG